jgi:hypothetical protein
MPNANINRLLKFLAVTLKQSSCTGGLTRPGPAGLWLASSGRTPVLECADAGITWRSDYFKKRCLNKVFSIISVPAFYFSRSGSKLTHFNNLISSSAAVLCPVSAILYYFLTSGFLVLSRRKQYLSEFKHAHYTVDSEQLAVEIGTDTSAGMRRCRDNVAVWLF